MHVQVLDSSNIIKPYFSRIYLQTKDQVPVCHPCAASFCGATDTELTGAGRSSRDLQRCDGNIAI